MDNNSQKQSLIILIIAIVLIIIAGGVIGVQQRDVRQQQSIITDNKGDNTQKNLEGKYSYIQEYIPTTDIRNNQYDTRIIQIDNTTGNQLILIESVNRITKKEFNLGERILKILAKPKRDPSYIYFTSIVPDVDSTYQGLWYLDINNRKYTELNISDEFILSSEFLLSPDESKIAVIVDEEIKTFSLLADKVNLLIKLPEGETFDSAISELHRDIKWKWSDNGKQLIFNIYKKSEGTTTNEFIMEKSLETNVGTPSEELTDFCTAPPRPTEIGRDIYPINKEKYGYIGFLGELFTADDCGKERVSKIFGVEGELYTLMPDIGLKNYPTIELILVLREIGFEYGDVCDTKMAATLCTHWTLMKIIPIDTILKLKPFATQIRSSGCINCG